MVDQKGGVIVRIVTLETALPKGHDGLRDLPVHHHQSAVDFRCRLGDRQRRRCLRQRQEGFVEQAPQFVRRHVAGHTDNQTVAGEAFRHGSPQVVGG